MVLVDGDVVSDIVSSYITWIACMLREIELMTLVCIIYLAITNWRLIWSLHMKSPRTVGGHFEKIDKSYKFSQKSETSGHQSNNSNYNNHRIYYLS